jgi:hypothetical protein
MLAAWISGPLAANPLQPNCENCGSVNGDAFVAKLNPAGSALVYSTYLGGSDVNWGNGIAVDSSGNAYVTGSTTSIDFPIANPLQASFGGGNYDAFVAKLNAAGSALVYSTYLGGSRDDWGFGIAVDSSGNAYVAGITASTDFPSANPPPTAVTVAPTTPAPLWPSSIPLAARSSTSPS